MNWENGADIARALAIGADLWLIALLLRIMWLRRNEKGTLASIGHASPLTMLAFIGYVLLNLSERADHLGDEWTPELVGSLIAVTLGIVGVLSRVKVGVEKPNRNGGKRWTVEERYKDSDGVG
jgi:hypothetical protein